MIHSVYVFVFMQYMQMCVRVHVCMPMCGIMYFKSSACEHSYVYVYMYARTYAYTCFFTIIVSMYVTLRYTCRCRPQALFYRFKIFSF
jgi:hypothetical protein